MSFSFTAKEYNVMISAHKSKDMTFKGFDQVRCKTVIDKHPIERENAFKFLGNTPTLSFKEEIEVSNKIEKF